MGRGGRHLISENIAFIANVSTITIFIYNFEYLKNEFAYEVNYNFHKINYKKIKKNKIKDFLLLTFWSD